MQDEREVLLTKAARMRDLSMRTRRIARTVPTPWVIDTMNEYAAELDEKVLELERRASESRTTCSAAEGRFSTHD